MSRKTYQLTLNFDQILDLVKQLPQSDKIRLIQELVHNLLLNRILSHEAVDCYRALLAEAVGPV